MEQGQPSPRRRVQKQRLPVWAIVLIFIAVAGFGYIAGILQNQLSTGVRGLLGGSDLDVSSLQQTYHALKENYDGTIDDKALIDGANQGMVSALGDEYTVYMNRDQTDEFDDSLSGNIGGGVGIEVGLRDNQPTVLRLLRDNPAEKAGLQVGDTIIAVNDESVQGVSVNDTVEKIRGDVGTTVKLTVLREGQTKEFVLTRAQVNNPSVYWSVEGSLGIMTITRFDDQTGSLARQAAREFKDKNVSRVILDLRGNGGGYVTAAKDVASIWLNDKLIVTEKSGNKVIDEIYSSKSPILEGVPTVVLVNSSSASASEIVAGALQDHKAATLLGETTFGKGSVQRLVNLSDGATLKVTVARWYTPSGVNISEKGITPDKQVTRSAEETNAGRDPQFDAAKVLLES